MTEKHAYLIMAHDNLYVLSRLLRMLDDERNDIFLHIDKKADFDCRDENLRCVKKARLFFAKPMSVFWGHCSQVDCEMRLLKLCVSTGKYSYVHLISGTCLPIKTQDDIHEFFNSHRGKQFLQVGYADLHLYRLNKYHLFVKRCKSRKPYMEYIISLCDKFGAVFKIDRLKKYSGLKIVKTANWFSVTGECAEYIVSRAKFIRKLTRHTVCADEMFLGTVIFNSKFGDTVFNPEPSWDGHMRYIDRERNVGSSPHTFVMEDKDKIDSSSMLYARKFDSGIDKDIIDYVYEKYTSRGI